MRTTGRRVLGVYTPLKSGGSAAPPPPPPTNQHRQDWFDNRVGYGKTCDAGMVSGYTTYTVINNDDTNSGAGTSGTLRWCLAQVGKTIVEFAPGIGDITDVAKAGYTMTDDTLLDGWNWSGTFYGSLDSSNCDNVVIMYMSLTQPFQYYNPVTGKVIQPNGGMFTGSNCPRFYIYHCTAWDSADIISANGAYQLHPGGVGDQVQPYNGTVHGCLWGPNPGWFAIMAPIRGNGGSQVFTPMGAWAPSTAYPANSSVTYDGATWVNPKAMPNTYTQPPPYGGWGSPGRLNGIDGDFRNGKGMNDSYDHQAVQDGRPLADFFRVASITMYENVLQGIQIRNGKARDEICDFTNNVVTKFGTAQAYGGPGINNGAGSAVDDAALMNIEGNVYISYEDNEQFLGFMDAVADALAAANPTLGIKHIRVVQPRTRNVVIKMENKATTIGDARIRWNWLDGLTPEVPKFSNGIGNPAINGDRGSYTLPHIDDMSNYANAQALVHKLCDDPATKSGNPRSTLQPPSWRAVHTASTFPVTP